MDGYASGHIECVCLEGQPSPEQASCPYLKVCAQLLQGEKRTVICVDILISRVMGKPDFCRCEKH